MSKCFVFVLISLFSFQASASLKFTTYNIRMFDSNAGSTNKYELKKIITKVNPDILTVEEIVNARSFKKFIKKEFKNTYAVHLSVCGGRGRQLIGFVYKKSKFKLNMAYDDNRLVSPIPFQSGSEASCGSLRPALIGMFTEIKTKREFVVIGIHLKAGGRPENYKKRALQYKLITKIIREFEAADFKDIILMGDFNSTGYIRSDEDYMSFTNMLRQSSLSTTAKNLRCTAYWSGENRTDNIEESSILDHVLFPNKFLGYKNHNIELAAHCKKESCRSVSSSELGTSYNEVSDHCPVSVIFR